MLKNRMGSTCLPKACPGAVCDPPYIFGMASAGAKDVPLDMILLDMISKGVLPMAPALVLCDILILVIPEIAAYLPGLTW